MNLTRLRHCVVVADLGSFTRAASFLGMPQSVLSRQVREVEDLLGVSLLHRTGRGAVLTEAGAALLPQLRALVGSGDALLEQAREMQSAPSGIVRLGMLTSLTGVLLSPLLSLAAQRLPGVRLHVMDALTHHLDELLVTNRLDLAVLYKDRQVPQPTDQALLQTDLCLIGPSGDALTRAHSVRLADLAGLKLTLPSPPNRMRFAIGQVCRHHGVTLNVVAALDSIGTLKDLVTAGTTHTILPPHFVAPEVAAGRLQASRIVDPVITRTVLLASATQGPMGRACAAVAALVREVTTHLVQNGTLAGRVEATASASISAPSRGPAQMPGTRAPSQPRPARAAGTTDAPSRKPTARHPV